MTNNQPSIPTPARVFVVSDSDNFISRLKNQFGGEGYQITCAQSSQEALNVLRESTSSQPEQRAFDLVLLNLSISDSDDFVTLEHICSRSTQINLPVFMLIDSADDKDLAFEIGASDCIIKPFHTKELITRIERILLAQQAKQMMSQHKELLASSFDGIISVNCVGKVTEFNAMAEHILGYRAAEVIGEPVRNLYSTPL